MWLATSLILPKFVGLFEIERVVKPLAVRLRLSASMKVNPTIHVFWVKPVTESELAPQTKDPPQSQIIDGMATFNAKEILDMCHCGRE